MSNPSAPLRPPETVTIDPGTGAPVRSPEHEGDTRHPLLLFAVVAAVIAAAVGVAVLQDDPSPPPPEPEPALGLFELDRVDLLGSPGADETTFPLFDRDWDETLLFAQRLGIVAVDLDSGAQRIWLPRDDSFAPGGWNGVEFVDGTPYVSFGWGGVVRIEDGEFRTVVAESEPGQRQGGVYGHYGLRLGRDDDGDVTFEVAHLETGRRIDLLGVRRFAVLGDDVLAERDGAIEIHTPDGGIRGWRDGELLAAGPGAVVWRECTEPGCATWAGTVDHPAVAAIDVPVDRLVALRQSPLRLDRLALPVLSPGGRYAPAPADTERGIAGLVDLTTGDVVVTGPHLRWTDDLSAAVTVVEPTVALIDTATGAVARIPLLEGAGARRGTMVTVVPTDELPDLAAVE